MRRQKPSVVQLAVYLCLAIASPSALAATLQVVVPGPYPENSGQGAFNVQLQREPSDVGACQVNGEVTNGPGTSGNVADADVDYNSFNFGIDVTLQVNDNVVTQTFAFGIIDDALYEGPSERFSFSLNFINFSCPFPVNVIQGTDLGTIAEDETPQFTAGFSTPTASVDESAGSYVYDFGFAQGNLDPGTFTLQVNVQSNAGTATSPADFGAYTASLTFGSSESQSDSVSIVDDVAVESTESFTLDATASLIDRDGVAIGVAVTTPQQSIDIVDNDVAQPGFIDFAQPTFTVDEGAGTLTVTLTRTGGVNGAVSADYLADLNSGDTATPGVDFTATSGTLNWADGDGTPKTFTVTILDDAALEATESFTVSITAVGGGAQLGNTSSATVSITDNDDQVDPGPDESVDGGAGETVSVVFAVAGAAPFTLSSNIGTVSPATLPAPGNATFSFDIPAGTQPGTVFVATVSVTNAASTTVTKDITISVVANRVLSEIPGLTPNQRALARYLDAMCPRLEQLQNVNDEQGQLQSACLGLRDAGTSDAQVVNALDAINPEELIVAATTALRLTSMQNGNLMQRINSLRSGASGIDLAGLNVQIGNEAIAGVAINEIFKATVGKAMQGIMGGGASADDFARWGLFANGNVKFGDKDATDNEAGFDYDAIGITTGVDYRFRDNLVFGAALGYASVKSDFSSSKGELDIKAWSASLFGTYFVADKYYLDGMLTYGQNDYDTTRQISYTDVFGPINETASGDTDGLQLSGGLSGGYDFNRGPWTFGPHLGAYYFDVDVDEFSESGAGGYNLDIGDQNAQSFQLNGGGHVSVVVNRAWGVFIPHARVDYVHELMDSAELVGVRLANDPFATDPSNPTPIVRLRTDRPDTDYFVMSLGASAQFINGISGFVNYRTMAGFDDFTMSEFTWGLRFERSF
jgi:uncharacterized protein YhjY with autotransporter beta-barrel domain